MTSEPLTSHFSGTAIRIELRKRSSIAAIALNGGVFHVALIGIGDGGHGYGSLAGDLGLSVC
jgi:hypothetical protein